MPLRHAETMKLAQALSRLHKADPAAPPLAADIICGFTAQPLSTFLAAHLQARAPGKYVKLHESPFGDLTGSLDRYLKAPSGTAALAIEWLDLDARLGWRRHGGWGRAKIADIRSAVEWQLGIIASLLESARDAGVIAVALPSLDIPPVEPLPGWQYGELRSRLDALAASFAARLAGLRHVRMVNPARLAALSPPGARLNVKTLNQAGFPYQLPHAAALAGMLAELLLPAPPLKGIITDLDNTLWSGILGEAGVDGIAWDLDNHAAHHGVYQQMLQALADSGVLVAAASKNDPELARAALARSDMLLRAQSIFPVEAHWHPKSQSVARILKAWNIAPDSVVFIDDSALELAEVTNAFPALQCRRFPEDPNDVAALLSELADLYGKPFDSAEDALRLESLRAGAELEEKLGSESLEEVLAGAEGTLGIARLTDPPDPRALELINKTNQFNLNGRRFSEGEWLDYLKTPDHCAWIASYGDRFGPLGKIAVAAGRFNGDGELHLDAWVLSCRAFGRRIEYAMLGALFERHGLKTIRFEAERTERNGPLREMLTAVTGCDAAPGVSLDCSGFSARKQPWYMRVEYAYE